MFTASLAQRKKLYFSAFAEYTSNCAKSRRLAKQSIKYTISHTHTDTYKCVNILLILFICASPCTCASVRAFVAAAPTQTA